MDYSPVHEGGVVGYTKSVLAFHKELDRIRQCIADYGYNIAYSTAETYKKVLIQAINELDQRTFLFSVWTTRKRYFDRRPIQRFLMKRVVSSTRAKLNSAIELYLSLEQRAESQEC